MTWRLDLNSALIAHDGVRGALRAVAFAAAAGDADAALDHLAAEVYAALQSHGAPRPTSADQVRRALAAGPGVEVD